jgi:hypothetical protein
MNKVALYNESGDVLGFYDYENEKIAERFAFSILGMTFKKELIVRSVVTFNDGTSEEFEY